MIEDIKYFDNVVDAVTYCINNFSGQSYIFRGQRDDWPLRSTLFRITENEREANWHRTINFCRWMLNNPYLKPYHEPEDKLAAIAQHYGFPTDLLDFTRDPKVAAFFASTGDIDIAKPGVILVVNIDSFKRLSEAYKVPGLLTFQINGLWRLENQQGVFLRDHHGFMDQVNEMGYMDYFLEKILFKQIHGISITSYMPEINESLIYPEPNDLEREIERYEDIRLRSRPMNLNNFSVHHIERDPLGVSVEDQVPFTLWEDDELVKWKTVSQIRFADYPKIDSKDSINIVFDNLKPGFVDSSVLNKYIAIVRDFHERIKVKNTTPIVNPIFQKNIVKLLDNVKEIRFSSKDHDEFNKSPISKISNLSDLVREYFADIVSKSIQDILAVSTFLPYNEEQVAMSIQTNFSININKLIHNLKHDESYEIVQHVYGKKIIELEYEDEAGIVSRCWAPNNYFDSLKNMTKVRHLFKEHTGIELNNNYQLFQFIHDIRKIMSLTEAINLWANIILPSDIFFRTKSSRILNPYYVRKIGYA